MLARYLAVSGRPALSAGLRAAVLTTGPAFLAVTTGRPALTWIALAAWVVGIGDVGGAYTTRAAVMGSVTVLGVGGSMLGSLAAASLWTAVPFMFVAGTALSLLRVLGSSAATVGSLVLVLSTIGLGASAPTLAGALERGAYLLGGGVLAMTVALALWRIYPYEPVRQATAACWTTLAEVTEELRRLSRDGASVEAWNEWIRRTPRRLREVIQTARLTLVATRVGRPAESTLGEQLHVLVEEADREFAHVVALGEQLEQCGLTPEKDGRLAEDVARFARIAADIRARKEVILDGAPPPARPFETPDLVAAARARLATVGDQLTLGSAAFRHALRVGVAGTIGVIGTRLLGIDHGTWVTLTAVVILQPSAGATRTRAVQRLAGTVVGGALAGVIGILAGSSYATVAVLAVTVFAARALLPMSYAYFSVFVTPAFVLFTQLTQHTGHLALVRITDSFVGGAIALAMLIALPPLRSTATVRLSLADALERGRALFATLFAPLLTGARASEAALAEARFRVGLANTAAEDALQRLLDDRVAGDAEAEAIYTLSTYARRFVATVIALLPSRDALEDPALRQPLAAYAGQVDAALLAMITSLRKATAEPASEIPAADVAPPELARRLARIAHQVVALQGAVARLLG